MPVSPALKNASELAARLDLAAAGRLLLVDAPETLRRLIAGIRPPEAPARAAEGKAIRSVKETFDAILVWREDRAGSRSLLDHLVKLLEPSGSIWVVTAMRKVTGPKTPAARRLELSDLLSAFSKSALKLDGEVRVTAWHVAYRFRAGSEDRREATNEALKRNSSLSD